MAQQKRTTARSEKVRKRHQKGEKTVHQKQRRKKERVMSGKTPVMIRTAVESSTTSRSKRKKKRVKRRYDIALPTPGVEMRLPSIPTIKVGWRLLSFVLLIGLSASIYFAWTSPIFQVQEVYVDGVVQYTSDTISRGLLVYQKPIFLIEPEIIEQQLINKFPGLGSATVQVGFPADIVVRVEERVPVILWEQDDNYHWVDAHGIAFEPPGEALGLVRVQASASPPAPIISEVQSSSGLDDNLEIIEPPKALMSPEMVEAILDLGQKIPEGITLLYDGEHGFGWRDPNGWDVYFGLSDVDMEMKLQVYASLVQRLKADGIQPAIISVEFLHAPYYRMER